MKLYDAPSAPNPLVVRLFIAERGGLNLQVEHVDLANLDNRGAAFTAINPFGTVPALVLDDGTVVSDILAVCEYLDEVAAGGPSLIGSTPEERALTRMWTRRVDKDVVQPFISWWRGTDHAVDFYRGHRVPQAGGQAENKLIAMRGLNRVDAELQNKPYLHGAAPGLADIVLFACMVTMQPVVPWLLPSGRRGVSAWFERMAARPSLPRARQSVASIAQRHE